MYIDLNADLGESFGNYKIGNDEAIIPLITSANIACGMHAGDFNVLNKTIELCKKHGTGIGAHPGYADIQGFGRRNIDMSPLEVENLVTYQLGAIDAFCKKHGVKLNHVKPHGALYNATSGNEQLSQAIVNAIYNFNPELKVMGISGGTLVKVAQEKGMSVINEVFADRNYTDEGTLVSRKEAHAMIHDQEEAVEHVLRMVRDKKVKTETGKLIDLEADSICVHGDGPEALAFVKAIIEALNEEGINIQTI